MKNYQQFILSILVLVTAIITGCEQEFGDDLAPEAVFNLSTNEPEVLEIVKFESVGNGEFFTVFPGEDSTNTYDIEGAIGLPTDEQGNLYFSYNSPGTFTLTVVASTFKEGSLQTDIATATMTVANTGAELTRIGFNLGNYFNAGLGNIEHKIEVKVDTTMKDVVPTIIYNQSSGFDIVKNRLAGIIPVEVLHFSHYSVGGSRVQGISEMRLNPSPINVNSSAVLRVGKKRSNSDQGDGIHFFGSEFVPTEYLLEVPGSNFQRSYTVCVLQVPEFSWVSSTSANTQSRQIPSSLSINELILPVLVGPNTDKSAVELNFELNKAEETTISYNATEIRSGDKMDLSNQVALELTYQQPSFEEVFAVNSIIHARAIEVPLLKSFSVNGYEGVISALDTLNFSVNEDGTILNRIYHINIEMPASLLDQEGLPASDDLAAVEILRNAVASYSYINNENDIFNFATPGGSLVFNNEASLTDLAGYFVARDNLPAIRDQDRKRLNLTHLQSENVLVQGVSQEDVMKVVIQYRLGIDFN
jgi:hypothetical protein